MGTILPPFSTDQDESHYSDEAVEVKHTDAKSESDWFDEGR